MTTELTTTAESYLRKRGYDSASCVMEGLKSVQPGSFELEGIHCHAHVESVLFPVRSMSGRLAAIHLAGIGVKDYKTFYDTNHLYLPVIYGSEEDWLTFWRTGQVVVTEGVFDRIVVKRAFPGRAVVARLSKGITPAFRRLLERRASHLWLAFDNDEPGLKAAEKAEKRIKIDKVTRLDIPYKDANLLYEKKGLGKLRACLQRQFQAFDF